MRWLLVAIVALALSSSSVAAAGLPSILSAESIELCGLCPHDAQPGYFQFAPGTLGMSDGRVCFTAAEAELVKAGKKAATTKKKLKKDLKSKKISKKVYTKKLAKIDDRKGELAYLLYLEKQQLTKCSGANSFIVLPPQDQKLFPGQLCTQEYYLYNCSIYFNFSNANAQWSCGKTMRTEIGVAQDADVALVRAAGTAAERMLEILNQNANSTQQLMLDVQSYIATATPIVMAGGVPPPLNLGFPIPVSAAANEKITTQGSNIADFFTLILTTHAEDVVQRIGPLGNSFVALKNYLIGKYGSPIPKNLEGVTLHEDLLPLALAIMKYTWDEPSFAWTQAIFDQCSLVK